MPADIDRRRPSAYVESLNPQSRGPAAKNHVQQSIRAFCPVKPGSGVRLGNRFVVMAGVTPFLCSSGVHAQQPTDDKPAHAAAEPDAELKAMLEMPVPRTADFQVTGDGSNPAWEKTTWTPLVRRGKTGADYTTKIKVLYSEKGLYVLMDASDTLLTATMNADFLDLWNEDCFEFFLWPDERQTIYFEYEISPLGFELPILIPNVDNRFLGWCPWHYEGDRKIQKATSITGGPKESGSGSRAGGPKSLPRSSS